MCCKSAGHWLTAAAIHTDNGWTGVGHGHRDIWQLLCFRCMRAITTGTVIAYCYPRRPAQYICHQRQADTERRDVAASVLPSILSPPVRCPDNIRLTLRVKQANENVGYDPVMDSVECVRSTIDKYTCERCRQRQHMPRYAHVFIFEWITSISCRWWTRATELCCIEYRAWRSRWYTSGRSCRYCQLSWPTMV